MSEWALSLVLVAVGGAIGGVARYWLSRTVAQRYGETFPWGTLVVNVSGAACIGVIGGLLVGGDIETVGRLPLWLIVVAGMLGSYTTVSSFSLQTLALARSAEWRRAALNILGSVVLCLAAAAAGYAATLALLRG